MTEALIIPDNISIIPLPAKCPELNPGENIWQFMRDNWLSNRVLGSFTPKDLCVIRSFLRSSFKFTFFLVPPLLTGRI